jgi:hypothetical protein
LLDHAVFFVTQKSELKKSSDLMALTIIMTSIFYCIYL